MSKIIKNKTEDGIIEVVLYIRVSREEQARWGYSLDAQKERLIEYCKEKGYKIVEIYIDAGKTARTKLHRRKELMKLLEDAKNNKFQRIIVWRLDRWIRSVADYYKVQEVLDEHNITWECSDEKYETTTANGRYQLNNKLNDNQNESDKTSERIKFVNGLMIKNKMPIYGSQCFPIGFKVVGEKGNKKVIHDPNEEDVAYDIIAKFKETRSIRQTTIYLNETYDYRNFEYETVQRFLKNTLLYGCYRDVDDFCEPYMTKNEWKEMQAMIKRNNKDNTKENEYLFKTLIKCCDCHRIMTGNAHKYTLKSGEEVKSYSYRCGKHCGSLLCRNRKSVNQTKLEDWLIKNFFKELNNYTIKIESINDARKNIADNEKKIEKLNAKKDRLNELYLEGRIDRNKYNADYSLINDELEKLKEDERKNKTINLEKYKKMLDNIDALDLYNKLDTTHKRLFWLEYIDYIEQDEENEFKIFFKD